MAGSVKTGGANRGGSLKVIKVGPQKVDLSPKPKVTKIKPRSHEDLKRDGRHVMHKPTFPGSHLKYSHMDIAAVDKRNGQNVTRSISLRNGH